jgi:cellobiose phosphorylase
LGIEQDEFGDRGIRTKYSDDLLWLPYVVCEYIAKTGDKTILDINVGYIKSELLKENEYERYEVPYKLKVKDTIYDHCIRAIEKSLKLGEHNIPLFGSGDWCDGMNKVGAKGKGESVWLGFFIITILKQFINLCEYKNDFARIQKFNEMVITLTESLNKDGWDGNWYRRGYYDDGTLLGSVSSCECRIECIVQAWSVISEAGEPEKVKEAMKSLENHLVRRDEGIIVLLTPPFDVCRENPGYIKSYVPGVRENGGQYTHGAMWAIMALAILGDGDKAWEYLSMLNPINHGNTYAEAERYKIEPYVVPGDIYNNGRGGWSWYTGAASWMYTVCVEYLLGFKKSGDELIIDPCIPKKWDIFEIRYKYFDTQYNIIINNPYGVSKGVKSIKVNGMLIKGNKIKLNNDKNIHNVVVLME